MNQRNIIGTVYDSNQFNHNGPAKLFTGEISSTPEVLRQLWTDSMDLGFGIRSIKTGVIAYFTLFDIERDDEGDIVKFVFVPFLHNEALAGYRVFIYNT